MKKKILFNGLGNRGWIGGLYYLKNILFSCMQSEAIRDRDSDKLSFIGGGKEGHGG